jgi:hypothetical protein
MILVPNTSYGQKKGVKSSIERKSERILAQADDRENTGGFLIMRTVKTVIYNDNAKRDSPGAWIILSTTIENRKLFTHVYSTKQRAFDEAVLMAREDFKKEDVNRMDESYNDGTIILERFVRERPGSNNVENSRDLTYWSIEYEITKTQKPS